MSTWLTDQLPSYLLEDPFFRGLVEVFAALAAETRAHGDALPYLADLDVTPAPMLRFLGQWVGFDAIDPELSRVRHQEIVSQLGDVVAWRGTRLGLTTLLTMLTEDEADVVDSTDAGAQQGGAKVVTVRVRNTAWMTPERFLELVENEIPADCHLRLFLRDHELTSGVPARGGHAG
jgi:phage tail-like protein